nr:RNA polymerase sigma factor SigJ [uncultured Pseudomonas sp.]
MSDLQVFLGERPRLLALAYRMLGSHSEAEDIAQEVWLRWQALKWLPDNPQAYLTRMLSNLCLDQLRSRRRQNYAGPWVPEPLIEDEASSAPEALHGRWQTLSLAFLLVLEQLTPSQRVVWVLREVFGYAYDELATLLERSPASCRKLFERAGQRLEGQTASPTNASDMQLAQQCLLACLSGDTRTLTRLLAEDVQLHSDGGGLVLAALRPIFGAEKTLRFFAGLQRKNKARLGAQFLRCNGAPALVLFDEGRVQTLLCCEVRDGRVTRLLMQRNPNKLAALQQWLDQATQ